MPGFDLDDLGTFAIFGIVLLVMGSVSLIRYLFALRRLVFWRRADATVVDSSEVSRGEDSAWYQPIVEFTTADGVRVGPVSLRQRSPRKPEIGDRHRVLYNPRRPFQPPGQDRWPGTLFVLLIFGPALTLVGSTMVIMDVAHQLETRELMERRIERICAKPDQAEVCRQLREAYPTD
jgi:hypothetical protein